MVKRDAAIEKLSNKVDDLFEYYPADGEFYEDGTPYILQEVKINEFFARQIYSMGLFHAIELLDSSHDGKTIDKQLKEFKYLFRRIGFKLVKAPTKRKI